MTDLNSPGPWLAVLQFHPVLGDLDGNARRLAHQARAAWQQGARLVLAPELALCGYPPEDLQLRPAFMQACDDALGALARDLADCDGLHLALGHPAPLPVPPSDFPQSRQQPLCVNAASVLAGGQVLARAVKRELPNYQVFDERRYYASGFDLGLEPLVFTVNGVRVGLMICEDAWFDRTGLLLRDAGAQVLAVLNASPFHLNKAQDREHRMADLARHCGLPVVYAHGIGGQDELVFDGASFALDAQGKITARAPSFQEVTLLLSRAVAGTSGAGLAFAGDIAPLPDEDRQIWDALVLGLRDYVDHNRFPSVLLGLSGGIDSALVLALAVEALGAARVRTVMMPSDYTADISQSDAAIMARRLGVRHDVVAIAPLVAPFEASLAPLFEGRPLDATEENLQARARGMVLMALSNKLGGMVLTTGNKSEMATGYCTLYGDMAGGFAPLKDVCKTRVYRLSRWRNLQPAPPGLVLQPVRDDSVAHDPGHAHHGMAQHTWVIPDRIITRAPSAELRPDQTDQDSLPPYEVLDDILAHWMQDNRSIAEIVALGHKPEDVERITRLIKINEYKRRQSAPGTRVTHRAFGRDWRYPITSQFRA
ncbi:NAD+ synthase [Amphibiibacter pelophylacis]|uniref:NAD+ synthase n=1 Tax=Amphibiibacter pelophylacis TaxID=1799477 RepID=A0ACC6NZB6_9BURK